MKNALFEGHVVSVFPISQEEFDRAQLDARRIMGKSLAKTGEYLVRPQVGSSAHRYAQGILAVQYPAAFILTIAPNFSVHRQLVSMERLQVIE